MFFNVEVVEAYRESFYVDILWDCVYMYCVFDDKCFRIVIVIMLNEFIVDVCVYKGDFIAFFFKFKDVMGGVKARFVFLDDGVF